MAAKKFISAVLLRPTIFIRIMVGAVFLSEGMQKLLFATELGAVWLAKLGLPHPAFLRSLVGASEILCAIAILIGAQVRLAVIPLLVSVLVAISATTWPTLRDQGFWVAVHDGRANFCMVMGLLFIYAKGPGSWSLDLGKDSRHDACR